MSTLREQIPGQFNWFKRLTRLSDLVIERPSFAIQKAAFNAFIFPPAAYSKDPVMDSSTTACSWPLVSVSNKGASQSITFTMFYAKLAIHAVSHHILTRITSSTIY